jgi:hypothetical protein
MHGTDSVYARPPPPPPSAAPASQQPVPPHSRHPLLLLLTPPDQGLHSPHPPRPASPLNRPLTFLAARRARHPAPLDRPPPLPPLFSPRRPQDIEKLVKLGVYGAEREGFERLAADLELIGDNCLLYHGPESELEYSPTLFEYGIL